MPFQKGKSGNPGGRPKALVNVVEIARERTPKNIANLAYWADQREDGSIAVKASVALDEIAWGRPKQAVDLKGGLVFGGLLDKIRREAKKP